MKQIYIKCVNGLCFKDVLRDILSPLNGEYEFVDSNKPQFIIFGPYGNDIPPPGKAVRIGYFCENMLPDMSICDWAFGVPYEEDVKHPRYMRIEWHGVEPIDLVKSPIQLPQQYLESKTKFCNFLYKNPVPYRERFFRELSKYKPVDAPGQSMNNMPGIDINPQADHWETKRQFLQQYKFTIAFENYSYPGYHTEKIIDPMRAGSIPIYFGNPRISDHFNSRSFINGHEYLPCRSHYIADKLQYMSQPVFKIMSSGNKFSWRVIRKLKGYGRNMKMQIQTMDFAPLIERIICLDQDDEKYLACAAEPWFLNNVPPSNERTLTRWREIFLSA